MADQVELLKQLQAIDAQLYRLRKQLKGKPAELERVNAQVAAQSVKVKAVEDRLKSLQLAQKEKEIELQTREASVKKLQGQLSQVKTNKEYSTMQHEISTLKADNSVLEETILKGFDGIEQAAGEKQQEQARLAQEQSRLKAEQSRIEKESVELQGQIADLERSRILLKPEIPAPSLTVYERILTMRDGIALVPLIKESCGGCYRRLPPQVINQVHLKANLVTCESCNRILYLDADQS